MSCIKFFSNYVFDRDNEKEEAIFIDTRRNTTIMFRDITKKDIMQIFSHSWEEISASELCDVARVLFKRGVAYLSDETVMDDDREEKVFEQRMINWWEQVAYLSDGDYIQLIFNNDKEGQLFEQRMNAWWEQTKITDIPSYKLQKIYLSA